MSELKKMWFSEIGVTALLEGAPSEAEGDWEPSGEWRGDTMSDRVTPWCDIDALHIDIVHDSFECHEWMIGDTVVYDTVTGWHNSWQTDWVKWHYGWQSDMCTVGGDIVCGGRYSVEWQVMLWETMSLWVHGRVL